MRSNLRLVEPHQPEPAAARKPGPGVRECLADIARRSVLAAAALSGAIYVAGCIAIAAEVWMISEEPAAKLIVAVMLGLFLYITLRIGTGIARRLRPTAQGAVHGAQVIEHHHYTFDRQPARVD